MALWQSIPLAWAQVCSPALHNNRQHPVITPSGQGLENGFLQSSVTSHGAVQCVNCEHRQQETKLCLNKFEIKNGYLNG